MAKKRTTPNPDQVRAIEEKLKKIREEIDKIGVSAAAKKRNSELSQFLKDAELIEAFLSKKYYNKDMAKAIAKIASSYGSFLGKLEEIVKNNEELRETATDVLNLAEDLNSSYKIEGVLRKGILEQLKDQINLEEQYRQAVDAGKSKLADAKTLLKDKQKIYSKLTTNAVTMNTALTEVKESLGKLQSLDALVQLGNPNQIDVLKDITESMGFELGQSEETMDALLDSVKLQLKERIKITKELQNQLVSANKFRKTSEEFSQRLLGTLDLVKGITSSIPLVGSAVAEDIEQIKLATNDAIEEMIASIQRGESVAESWKSGMKSLGGIGKMVGTTLTSATGGLLLFALVLKKAFGFLTEISAGAKSITTETGLTADQGYDIYTNAIKTNLGYKNQIASLDDILSTQKEIIGAYGRFTQTDPKILIDLVEASKVFGYTTEEAGKLHAVYQDLGADDRLGAHLQIAVGQLAQANKIAPGIIAKDMVQNAEFLGTLFSGYPKEAAKATVEVYKLGYNLSQASKVMDHLFQVESSLTAQMEASVGLNRMVDLSKARQYALDGNMAEMMREITSQVGSYYEFTKLNIPQRRLLAKAAGMEVGELTRSLVIREKLSDLTDEEQAKAMGALKNLEGIENLSRDALKVEYSKALASERFNTSLGKIKSQLMVALLPLMETLASALSALAPIVSQLGNVIQGAFAPFTTILDLILFKFGDIKTLWSNLFKDKGPLGLVSVIIGSIVGGVVAIKQLMNLGKGVLTLFGTISTLFGKKKEIPSPTPSGIGTHSISEFKTGVTDAVVRGTQQMIKTSSTVVTEAMSRVGGKLISDAKVASKIISKTTPPQTAIIRENTGSME